MPTISAIRSLLRLSMAATGALAFQQRALAQGPEERPLVSAVELRGVRHVDIDQLRAGLATRPTQCKNILYYPICLFSKSPTFAERRHLDELEVQRDVVRIRLYYWLRGYRDTEVSARVEGGGGSVKVVFSISENEPTVIEALEVVHADSALATRQIDMAMYVKEGDPLNLVAIDSSTANLRDALWELGYADAVIDIDTSAVSDVRNAGPVRVRIDPGSLARVASVTIEGNHRVSDATIRRLLHFTPGGLFRRGDVLESVRTLYLSGLFSEVEFRAPPPGDPNKMVSVIVSESDLHRLDLSGGFTSIDFFQAEAQFTRLNFVGGARQLTVNTTVSNLLAPELNNKGLFSDVTNGVPDGSADRFLHPTWSASISFLQPWLLSPRNQFGASVFTHRRTVPGIVVDRGAGFSLNVTHDLAPRDNSTIGYTWETSEIDASSVYFCVTFGVCEPKTIAVMAARHTLAGLASVTQLDRTDNAFAPSRGYRARLDIEHASSFTRSDFRFNRGELTGSAYFGLSRRAVLAARVRVGYVRALGSTEAALGLPQTGEPIIHPRKRFYAGGSRSVRGYGENQLGPRVLTVSPEVLTDTALADPCSLAELEARTCDPNIEGVGAGAFSPQPLGGTSVAEASIEYRFPLSTSRGLTGAVFVDGAVIGTSQLTDLLGTRGSVTPGFGVRLVTPVGPVRLDLGVKPTLVERLPVITQLQDTTGGDPRLVTLATRRLYDPLDRSGGFLRGILSRLALHLAIGPAF